MYELTDDARFHYFRGRVHGVCFDCKKKEQMFNRDDLTFDDICGKQEFCKTCEKFEEVKVYNSIIESYKKKGVINE